MAKYDKADIERRMKGAVDSLRGDLSGLRTGRANVSLLDPVVVEVYGAMMPLNQVATVSAPEPRMLSVQVWDKANVTAVEKGIAKANLGLNPMQDGQTIHLPFRPDRHALVPGRARVPARSPRRRVAALSQEGFPLRHLPGRRSPRLGRGLHPDHHGQRQRRTGA